MLGLGTLLGGLGGLLSGGAQSAASERMRENDILSRQDQTRATTYGTQQAALANLLALLERGTMDRAQLGITAPSARAQQMVKGSLMANAQPARITPPAGSKARIPQLSGGLTPAAMSPAARTAGGELQRQALLALLSGRDVPALPNYRGAVLPQPQLSQLKQPGKLESILAVAGPVLSGAGMISGAMKPPKIAGPKPGQPGYGVLA